MAKLVRLRGIAEWLGVKEVTVWRWRKAGQFPPPYRLGKAIAWDEADVIAWLESRREGRAAGTTDPAQAVEAAAAPGARRA